MTFPSLALGDFRRGRTRNFGATRILTVVAVAGAIALAGCSDSTAPVKTTTPTEPIVTALIPLASELHDGTDMFVAGMDDQALGNKVKLAINDLGNQLLAGKLSASRAALTQVRSLLVNLDDISAIELAPVGLGLDYIEQRINEVAPK